MQQPAGTMSQGCTSNGVIEALQSTFILALGSLPDPGHLILAEQALDKAKRVWSHTTRLIVAAPAPECAQHASFETQSIDRLQSSLPEYDRCGRLLCAEGDVDNLTLLHAIASGVPLEALNLTRQGRSQAACVHGGDAFLAV